MFVPVPVWCFPKRKPKPEDTSLEEVKELTIKEKARKQYEEEKIIASEKKLLAIEDELKEKHNYYLFNKDRLSHWVFALNTILKDLDSKYSYSLVKDNLEDLQNFLATLKEKDCDYKMQPVEKLF